MACVIAILLCALGGAWANELEKTELRMPGVVSPAPETYLCRSMPLDEHAPHWLVGFEPHASMHTAHHILLFGCEEPGVPQELDQVWDCGEMSKKSEQSEFLNAPTCASGSQIIYAWARDAKSLQLPEGVGFKVGGDSRVRYLVMQVHYMHKGDEPDYSGLTLKSTATQMPRTAATMLMVTSGKIAPHTKEHFETACVIDEPVVMHPFAFRTHTHKHGKVVSGWKVQESDDGEDHWQLIGKQDPMKPQMFYPVENQKDTELKMGDVVAARCYMVNDEDRSVGIGATGADEMCNFYIMYWVDGDRTLSDNTCMSPGPPNYYWARDANLNHIPEKQADSL